MEKHPIENIMNTTLGHLKEMTDVNTVVGSPTYVVNVEARKPG